MKNFKVYDRNTNAFSGITFECDNGYNANLMFYANGFAYFDFPYCFSANSISGSMWRTIGSFYQLSGKHEEPKFF